MADKPYVLGYEEKNEMDFNHGKFLTHFYSKQYPGETHKNWYAGITGQKDNDKDGKSDRYLAHKVTYENMDHDSWMELEVTNDEVAKAIEIKLRDAKFDTGDRIQGDDNIDKVYIFRKVIWPDGKEPATKED